MNYITIAKPRPSKQVFGMVNNLLEEGDLGSSAPLGGALKDPFNPDNYKMQVAQNRPPSTVGHEIKHLLEYMESLNRMPKIL